MKLDIGTDNTFEITAVPTRVAQQKTLRRLMRLQPDVQKGLKMLQGRRKRIDNNTYIRAGRPWTDRARATKLTRVELGETFTIRVTPHIVPDIQSVEKFLAVK